MSQNSEARPEHALVIHGGVGTLARSSMTEDQEEAYRTALRESLRAGHAVLREGGRALDAVVAAVRVMEDSPLFNAGRGSNFDERGVVTMDASVMDGATLDAGAVAAVSGVRNPVELARLVMDRSDHLMLVGDGAERFARAQGVERAVPEYFHTAHRWDALQRARAAGRRRPNVLGDGEDGRADGGASSSASPHLPVDDPVDKSGTVGAVALDPEGRLAAGTSTGGMANKSWGRVGDSPVIGSGTYASGLCAVSCTGWGEYFIRNVAAYDVHARMAHAGATLAEAVREVVFETLERQVPRSGGMIALDAEGRVEMCFNTPGMYRGRIGPAGEPEVAIWES